VTNPILFDLPTELHAQRLTLRAPRAGDGPAVNAAILDSANELEPWMPWARPTPSVQDSEIWCRQAAVKWLARQQFHLSLYLAGTDTCIGNAGLHHVEWDNPAAEMGYWLRTPYCGKGLMHEAVLAVERFAFDVLRLRRIEIRCNARNVRSGRVAERAGYQLEGTLRAATLDADHKPSDEKIYAKLATRP
jgi:RimJ/RimL family protein N-acetyltransferase